MGQFITNPLLAVPPPTQQPSGRMFRNGNQAGIAGGGIYQQILLNAISPNFIDGIEDVVNAWILPGVTGWYQVNASIKIDHPNTADVQYSLHVLRNPGGNLIFQDFKCPCTTAYNHSLNISDIVYLTNLQYLEMGLAHNAAAPETVIGQSTCTFLSVQRVR